MMRTTIYLSDSLERELQKQRLKQGKTMSAIIRELLAVHFQGLEKSIEDLALERAKLQRELVLMDKELEEKAGYTSALADLKKKYDNNVAYDKRKRDTTPPFRPLSWLARVKGDYPSVKDMKAEELLEILREMSE